MISGVEPSQGTHLVERLELTAPSIFPAAMVMDLLYIALVVTIVDPTFTRRELRQDACAGTLVRKNLVITSASCLLHTKHEHPEPRDTVVFLRNGEKLKPIRIYIHHGFTTAEEDYNIAAIEVEGSSKITNFPKLPTKSLVFENVKSECKLAGYGKIDTLKIKKSNFHILDMKTLSVSEFDCKIKSDHMFCLHFNNLLPCNGDVGSPIICNGELYAIFSPNMVIYPQVCMERYGTTFVKVYAVKDWIEGIINTPQMSMEWMNNPLYILLLCSGVLAVIGGIYYVIMEWLQKTFEPLATETVNEAEGDDDVNSEWNKS